MRFFGVKRELQKRELVQRELVTRELVPRELVLRELLFPLLNIPHHQLPSHQLPLNQLPRCLVGRLREVSVPRQPEVMLHVSRNHPHQGAGRHVFATGYTALPDGLVVE